MSVAPAGVALTGNTPGPESKYRLAPNRNNQWPSRLQILNSVAVICSGQSTVEKAVMPAILSS